jgi:predicted dehydrogenase
VTEPLGLGIVGCGTAALDVVAAVTRVRTLRIVAVHDRDPERAADVAGRAGVPVHAELAGLLADRRVDAVYVALPHYLLAPTAIEVLRSGRHVLVEKPLATSLDGLRAVREAATTADRRVGVMFQLRFTPAVSAATDLVRGGAIGRARLVRIRTLIDKPATYWESGWAGIVPDRWRATRDRAGGGILIMNTIHQLDAVRAVTGVNVERVSGEIATRTAGVDVEDEAVATLRFDDGALGAIVASAHAPGAAHAETIEIEGDEGTLRIPDLYVEGAALELYLRRPWNDLVPDRWLALPTGALDPRGVLLEGFAQSVAAARDPVPGLDEALAALATVLAIYESAESGRSVSL